MLKTHEKFRSCRCQKATLKTQKSMCEFQTNVIEKWKKFNQKIPKLAVRHITSDIQVSSCEIL